MSEKLGGDDVGSRALNMTELEEAKRLIAGLGKFTDTTGFQTYLTPE